MKIEKSSYSETYYVETDKYDIAIKYNEYFNLGYDEWELLSVQDKSGLEVKLSRQEERELEKNLIDNIIEFENNKQR